MERAKARGASTEVVLADLSLLTTRRGEAGEAIAAAHPRINLLVNNAGLITPAAAGDGRRAAR